MSARLQQLLDVAPVWVYVVVGALVFAEDAILLGMILPAETAVIIAGVAASRGNVDFWWLAAIVAVAATLGDSTGYTLGRALGPRILHHRLLERRAARVARTREFLVQRGRWAILLARQVAFVRTVMPPLAGSVRMPYRRFLPYSAAGSAVWAVTASAVGYLAAGSYATIARLAGTGSAVVVATAVALALIAWRVRVHRRLKDETALNSSANGRE